MTERIFTKSSYSPHKPISGDCVEVSPPTEMRVSSYSAGNGGACVQIAEAYDDCVMVGDSKIGDGPEKSYVHVSPEAFTAFTGSLALSEFARIDA